MFVLSLSCSKIIMSVNYVKILICWKILNCWKIQLQRQLAHIIINFSGQPLNFLLLQHDFQLFTYILITLIIWALFGPLVSSVKDENFQSASIFYQVIKFHFMRSHFEGNFIQTLLILPKEYSLFSSDYRGELDTPFPIKSYDSICRDIISFDVILP